MIHHFDGSHWLPGPDHRDGSRPFPAHPHAGLCFNDVPGAEGASPAAVAEGLPHLLMKQGAAQLIDERAAKGPAKGKAKRKAPAKKAAPKKAAAKKAPAKKAAKK